MKKSNDNGKISVKLCINSTIIYIPQEKMGSLIGFLKYQIFENRVDNKFIKDLIDVKEIIFERIK